MNKWLTWVPIVTFGITFVIMFAGQKLSIPALTYIGLFFLGITALVSAIRIMITGEAFFLPTGEQSMRRRAESYTGLAARLWGVFFILFAFALFVASAAMLLMPQSAPDFVDRLFDTPAGWGLLLMGIGIVVALYGATRVLAGAAAVSNSFGVQLLDVGYRVLGVILFFIGVGLAALGYMLVTSPETITTWTEQLIGIRR